MLAIDAAAQDLVEFIDPGGFYDPDDPVKLDGIIERAAKLTSEHAEVGAWLQRKWPQIYRDAVRDLS